MSTTAIVLQLLEYTAVTDNSPLDCPLALFTFSHTGTSFGLLSGARTRPLTSLWEETIISY